MRIVRDSLFFRAYLSLLAFLSRSAEESVLIGAFKRSWQNSLIVNARPLGRLSELWNSSWSCRFIKAAFNLPFGAAHGLRRAMTRQLDESVFVSLAKRLDTRLPFVIGAGLAILYVVPHSYFNNLYSLIMCALLLALTLFCVLAGNTGIEKISRAGFCYMAFGLMVLFSFVTSTSRGLSFRFLMFYATAFLALTLIWSVINSRRALHIFIYAILCAVTVSGLYGCYQGVVGVPVVRAQMDFYTNVDMPGRIFSFFENPNKYAELLVMTIPLYLAMFYTEKSLKRKLVIFIAALPPAISLLLTLSRSGWGALAIGVFVFFLLVHRAVLPAIIAAGFGVLIVLPSSFLRRLMTVFMGGDSSTKYRQTIREWLAPLLQDNWVFGTGLGSDAVQATLRTYYTEDQLPWWSVPAHAHNIYLQIIAEMGIFGLLAFAVLIIAFLTDSIKGIIKSPNDKYIIAAGVSGIIGMLIVGSVEYVWFYPRVMLMFWMVIGITLTASRLYRKD